MDSEEVFVGIAIIVGLAAACQLIAPKLKIPALVLLLPAGFIAGNVFDAVDPTAIFGVAFTPLVQIAVGIILFHGGLELVEERLVKQDRTIIFRLVLVGALITLAAATVTVALFLGVNTQISLLLGAIFVVSGPTVVGPLLAFARPNARVRRILAWEGTLIDPVGALIAVLVFQAVQASEEPSVGLAIQLFAKAIAIGAIGGLVGLALVWVGMKLAGPSRILGTEVLLFSVVIATAGTNAVFDDSGLVAAVLMGMVAPLIVKGRVAEVKPFFDTIVNASIGVLFISISALVTPESLQGLVLPCLGIVAVLVLVLRPLTALLLTIRSTLTLKERIYVGWMAPRGIVAASTAASFSGALVALGVPDSEVLLPVTFLVIVGTVVFYSATAVPMAGALGLREPDAGPDELVDMPEEVKPLA